MEPASIIAIATRVIGWASQAITAANNGDMEKAEEFLTNARDHWSEAATGYIDAKPDDS